MNSRKHGYPYPGQPPAQGGGAERPMFANDHHDDYPGQGGAAAAEPDFDSQGAAQLVLVGELAGDFKQAPDAL